MQLNEEHIKAFQQKILSWYSKNKRDLPWRKTRDPYCILISEVMSIGTEHLFIQKLLVFNIETKFQINLLQNSLEEFIGSTFIQIKYFEFEKKVFDSY